MSTPHRTDNPETDHPAEDGKALRRMAEEKARGGEDWDLRSLSAEETRRLLHELRVHQIELEMQNEELRRAQQELEASRARYLDLFDFAPVGYCTVSENGILLDANLTAAALFNTNRGALIKQPLSRFILPEDQDIYYRHRKLLFETGQPQVCELRMRRTDNPPFWAELKASVVRGAEGSPVCRFAMSDITERKRAEEERAELEAQVHEAQRMELVARLAGGVAHDFNNMLCIILGYGENLLAQLPEGDPLRQEVEQILEAGRRSAELTRQLLGYARKQVISPSVLDLNDVVEVMLKMLRRLIGEDINLVWLPGHALWRVKIDPSQVDQVLANLVVNARDAIAGVGKVTVQTSNATLDAAQCAAHAGAAPGDYVLLTVSDDGCGMSREVLDHLFEPFFTTKEVGKGTGMGLPTVHGIVKQNKGLIEVRSEPGKGATVAVYLPRVTGEAAKEAFADRVEPPRGSGQRVLLVEDEPALLQMSRIMLERLGYRLLTAAGPQQAMRMVREHGDAIHLLITDVVMPEMNGRALAKLLREIHPGLRCLFMSGYPAEIMADRDALDEAAHFIQKPFTLEDLAVKVKTALGGDGPDRNAD